MSSPAQSLAAAVLAISDPRNGTAPYFGSALSALIRIATTRVPTIAVSSTGILFYNPNFVEECSLSDLTFILEHEVQHVLLQHAERHAALGIPVEHATIANLAKDMSINEGLVRAGRKMPKGDLAGVLPATFGQPDNLIWEERYHLLLQNQPPSKAAGDVGSGCCGGCAGNPGPVEEGLEPTLGRSEAELHRVRRQTAEAIREHANGGRGTIPEGLARWAEDFLGPAKIDWRTKLARSIRSAVAYRPGCVDLGWSRPSRRQAGLGFGAGKAVLPAFRAPVVRVACIIDTSGSMGDFELGEAMSEVAGVLAALGAGVEVCVCDAAVHGLAAVDTWEAARALLRGGGGTDMRPAFEALAARRPPPEIVICLTDGCLGGGVPEAEPAGIHVIWVLLGPYKAKPCDWGEQIEIE